MSWGSPRTGSRSSERGPGPLGSTFVDSPTPCGGGDGAVRCAAWGRTRPTSTTASVSAARARKAHSTRQVGIAAATRPRHVWAGPARSGRAQVASYAAPMATTPGGTTRTTRIATWVTLAIVVFLAAEIGLAVTQSPRVQPPSPAAAAPRGPGRCRRIGRLSLPSGVERRTASRRSWWETLGLLRDRKPSPWAVTASPLSSTGQVAYFEGVAAALRDQLGLPAASASLYAGTWISLQQSDGPYPSVEGVTTSAALAQVLIAPSATSAHRIHGVLLSRITGRIPHGHEVTGSARLDVLSRSNLPAVYSAHGADGGQRWSTTITFSRWDVNSPVSAPAAALPFSYLQGSPPVVRKTLT